jgi:hypothetical protein
VAFHAAKATGIRDASALLRLGLVALVARERERKMALGEAARKVRRGRPE